jgi:tripartite-type tricarboxylate transporter receptor subunit TctC
VKKLLLTLALSALGLAAQAQNWPDKNVTLVVPFPPGGSTDQVARALASAMGEELKQSFIVDNRAGATGTIGAAYVKRATPDGSTFLVTSLGPLVIVPHLLKDMQFDPLKDFDPITVAVASPNVLVVPANSPYKSVADIVAYSKAHPGKLTFASSGSGSSDHLTAALFWQQTGTTGVHVPYRGGGPAQTDLMGGQVDASFQNINTVIQFIKADRMRPLAITSAKRSPQLPDVPTMAEAGVQGVQVTSWQAIVAPKGMPAAQRDKVAAAFVRALHEPKVKDQFVSVGYELVANTPAQFAAFMQEESDRWKKVIDAGHITAN